MQTFSQYAATRPLRRSSSGTIAVEEPIQTFAGVDVVTGMPVIVYTMPGLPPSIPEVYSESIPVVLETGTQDETGFVVVSSAPGYLPLRLGLSQVRLEWLCRISAKALSDAHAGDLVHGDLNPNHFFVQGDHLLLEGWGLNWQHPQADFTPPEGQGEIAADVFAWARTMQAFGKGDPRKLLDGEMGRLIGHCLNPKPQERPTALELVIALEQVIAKKIIKPEVKPVQLDHGGVGQETPIVVPLEQPSTEIQVEGVSANTNLELALTPTEANLEMPNTVPPEALQPLKLESHDTSQAPINEAVKIIAITKAPERISMNQPVESVTIPELKALESPTTPPSLEPVARGRSKSKSTSKSKASSLEPSAESELREPENLAADEPDIVPSVRPEHEPVALPVVLEANIEPGVVIYKDGQASSGTIRVGFEEDDSWRSVKTYQPPKRNSLILPIALIVAVLLGIFAVLGLTRGNPKATSNGNTVRTPSISNPSQNSIVNFVMKTTGNQTARLTVISAPKEAKLASGALLATIPGPVLFPYPGEYRVRITMPNFAPGEVTVNVPQDANTNINIELGKP